MYLYASKTKTNTSLTCDKYGLHLWEIKQHIVWFCMTKLYYVSYILINLRVFWEEHSCVRCSRSLHLSEYLLGMPYIIKLHIQHGHRVLRDGSPQA